MTITYINYRNITVELKYEKTFLSNDKYIKVYARPSHQSAINLTYNLINYKINAIYITSKEHNLPCYSQDYDGELIIENIGTTDSGSKKYVVFPLKCEYSPNKKNIPINQIINASISPTNKSSIDIDLANIEFGTYLINKSSIFPSISERSIIIFSTPIIINPVNFPSSLEDNSIIFSKFNENDYITEKILDTNTKTDIISNFNKSEGMSLKEYEFLDIFKNQNSILEGFGIGVEDTSGDAYYTDTLSIQCSPTGVSESTIQMTSIPINNNILSDIVEVGIMGTTINFFIFTCLVIFISIVSPFIYKYAIVQLVKNAVEIESKRVGSLFLMDLFVIILFLAFAITISIFGVTTNNFILSCLGISFCIYIFLSISIIYFNKVNDPGGYSLNDYPGKPYSINAEIFFRFFEFAADNKKDLGLSYLIYLIVVGVIIFSTVGYYGLEAYNMFFVYSVLLFYGAFMCFFILYNYKIHYDKEDL